jgi:hypothetical protein
MAARLCEFKSRPAQRRDAQFGKNMRSTLIFLHVLLSFLAFGGLLRVAILVQSIHKKPRRDLHGLIASFMFTGKQMSMVGVLVVAFGTLLAYHAGIFGQLWIWLSLVFYFLLMGTDHMAIRPSLILSTAKLEADMSRADNHDIAAELMKIKTGYGVMALLTVAILWLMVFKPA